MLAPVRLRGLGEPEYLQRAGTVGQAAEETPFFQGAYQPVYARFRFEPERLLHLLERGRDTARFQPLLDEVEKFMLLRGQHFGVSMLPMPDLWRTIQIGRAACREGVGQYV